MKIITNYDYIDKRKWARFIANHKDGNIFQTPEMYDVYQQTRNYRPIIIAAVDEKENIKGILLAVIQKEHSGIFSIFSSRAIIWGGPLIKENNLKVLDFILSKFNKMIKGKAIYSQFRNMWEWSLEETEIFNKNKFIFKDHLNILVDLTIGVDDLWKGTKRNRKDGINKAKRQGFLFEVKDNLISIDSFYSLFEKLYKKIKLPYPDISLFHNLNLDVTNNIKWFVLKYENKPCIILCSFLYNATIYAFAIGILQDMKIQKLRPVDLFYWEVIKWGSENGYNIFDWMGAGKPDEEYGVRKFKLQYGGKVLNLGRYEKIHKPFLFFVGKKGLKVWQKLK